MYDTETDFSLAEGNADLVADLLVSRLRDLASEMESKVNRLHRGRNAYGLSGVGRRDLEKTVEQLRYMVHTLQGVQAAQAPVRHLQAAE